MYAADITLGLLYVTIYADIILIGQSRCQSGLLDGFLTQASRLLTQSKNGVRYELRLSFTWKAAVVI